MGKEVYALINTEPNPHFSNCHRDLTIVPKPQGVETGIYKLREKEQALKDLNWHKEETGSHIDLKKVIVQDVDFTQF